MKWPFRQYIIHVIEKVNGIVIKLHRTISSVLTFIENTSIETAVIAASSANALNVIIDTSNKLLKYLLLTITPETINIEIPTMKKLNNLY